jgi:MATE family multidrug resistance protein
VKDYIAANAILINLVFLSAFILDAYAFSTEGMVGYSLGKKDLSLFKTIIKNSFILSSITGLIISIVYLLANQYVINLMSDIEENKSFKFPICNLVNNFAIYCIFLLPI